MSPGLVLEKDTDNIQSLLLLRVMELLDICVDHMRNQGIKESPHCTHGIYHFSYIVKEEQNSRPKFLKIHKAAEFHLQPQFHFVACTQHFRL